jgi:outer membrane receptor protein involved in Fe transport|tara:strand:+ start:13184 stop:15238 length:2055 start_codon:yes stop_codon:yes gene_type:complete
MVKIYFTCLLLFACSTAYSIEVLPEIVVTADFRNANEMDVASSISVISEEIVRSRSAQHFDDLIHTLPNVNYASGSNRARFFQIRGIGERSQFAAPLNSSVGLLIDNVDFSGAGSVATMMDVQQVEVLRGPQGTRYGANALAGIINIKTNDPLDTFAGNLKVSVADYATRTLGAMLTGPISERVHYRLVAEEHQSDGYYDNHFLGIDDTNQRDELTIRGKLHIQASDTWDLTISVADVDMDNGYDAFTLDNNRNTISDEPGHDRQDSSSFGIDSTLALTHFDLVTIVNFADSDMAYGYDEDWTYTGFHPWGYTSTDDYIRNRKTSSAEFRLISNESSRLLDESTDWIIGIYSLRSKENLVRQYTYLSDDFTSNYDFDTYAVFFQLDSSLTDKLVLSNGMRYEKRKTEYDNSNGIAFSPDEDLWGGRIALKFFASDRTMIYGSVARGYKAGGFNTDKTGLDEIKPEFDEEYLIEYEVGIKSRLLNNRLQFRASVFYDDRRDQQVKSSLVIARPDGTSEFVDFLGNAAEGTNRGLEVETNWYATDNFKVIASLGLLNAEFDEFINEFGEDLSGREQAHAPSYTYNLALEYRKSNWHMGISVDGKDEYFFSDRHAVKSDKYALLNAIIGYESERWKINIWGRNLSDKDYTTRAFGSFGNDPRKNYITEPYFQFGEPRIVGVSLEMGF